MILERLRFPTRRGRDCGGVTVTVPLRRCQCGSVTADKCVCLSQRFTEMFSLPGRAFVADADSSTSEGQKVPHTLCGSITYAQGMLWLQSRGRFCRRTAW